MKKKRHKWNARELFLMLKESLKKEGLIPEDLLDYSCAGSDSELILSEEFDVIPRIVHGSNEGIYMDVMLDTGDETRVFSSHKPHLRLGTFKTLRTDKEAYIRMSVLGAEFVYALHTYVRENMDEFNWTGFDLTICHGEKILSKRWILDRGRAVACANVFIEEHGAGIYAVIRNNENDKEEVIGKTVQH